MRILLNTITEYFMQLDPINTEGFIQIIIGIIYIGILIAMCVQNKQSNKNAQKSTQKAQDANDYTSFSHALTLFAAKEIEIKAIGLKLLIQIRNKPNNLFTEKIDLITKYIELHEANLAGANLQKANLEGAYLRGANLKKTNLTNANLYDSNLYRANLYGADLCATNLQYTNLYGVDLQGAGLKDANFQGAKLLFADFRSTKNLLQAHWAFAQNVKEAIFDDEETKQKVLALKAKQEDET